MNPRTLCRICAAISLLGLVSLGGCAYYPYGYGYYPGYAYAPYGYYPAYAAAAPIYGGVAIGFGGGWGGWRGGWRR